MEQKIENWDSHKKVVNKSYYTINKTVSMTLKYIKNEDGHFVCPDCGITKKNQNTMHYHMKKHEDQLNHVCKSCKKGFLQKQTLDLHIRSKHPELLKDSKEETKKFTCPHDSCDFSALTKGNCLIHYLRVHCQDEIKNIMINNSDTKTFTCNECNDEFNSSSAFYYHCKGCVQINNKEKQQMIREILA
jgi:hypothetical protein